MVKDTTVIGVSRLTRVYDMGSTYIPLYARIVDNLINVICRHSRLCSGSRNIEDFSC